MLANNASIRPTAFYTALLLLILILATYATGLTAGFVLDSGAFLLDDPRLKFFDATSLKLIFTENYWWPTQNSNLYRPLTTLSFLLNRLLVPNLADPIPFHIVNLILHYLNALLIAAITRRMLSPIAALLIAAVFAVHPLAVESVTNLVGRADLMATLTMLVGLMAHIRWTRGDGRKWLLLIGIAGILGVFCKESAGMLIGLLLAWDFCFTAEGRLELPSLIWWSIAQSRNITRGWCGYAALAPSWILLWTARHAIFSSAPVITQNGADNPLVLMPPGSRILTALSVQGRYIGQFFWPQWLSCDYSFDQISLWGQSPKTTAWLVFFMLSVVLTLYLGRRNRTVIFFALVAAAVMLPTSNLLMPIGTIMAERFMYLPVACLAAIVVIGAQVLVHPLGLTHRRPLTIGLAALSIIALSVRTAARNLDWRDELSIWTAAAAACPESFKVYQGQASAYMLRDGLDKAADLIIELLAESRRIIETDRLPLVHRPMITYSLLAQACRQKGDVNADPVNQYWYGRGLEASRLGLQIDAAMNAASRQDRRSRGVSADRIYDVGFYPLHLAHAALLDHSGQPDQALVAVDYARHLTPGLPKGHLFAAQLLQKLNRLDLAAVRGWQTVITGDTAAGMAILEGVYQHLSPTQRLVGRTATGYGMDMHHPLVTGHLDQALHDLTILCKQAGATDVARMILRVGRQEFDRPIDDLLGRLEVPGALSP